MPRPKQLNMAGRGSSIRVVLGIMKMELNRKLGVTMLVFAIAGANPALGQNVAQSGVNRTFRALGFPSPFGKHPKIAPIQIKGKDVYVLQIFGEKSRASNNFDIRGQKKFALYVANVDATTRMKMQFQRKGDKDFEDSNRGPILSHSKAALWTMEGGDNYLAARGFNAEQVLAKHPDALVLLAEEGVSVDEVLNEFKD